MQTLGLASWLVDICRCMRMTTPYPIQKAAVPKILQGENILACAPTGRGKTAAYTLPLLQKLSSDPHVWFGLILAPTRELCVQIEQQVSAFGDRCGIKTFSVIGGSDWVKERVALLEGKHVVIGTPGRLSQAIEDTDLRARFRRVEYLCIDECDKLREAPMWFSVEKILATLTSKTQRVCFTATFGASEDSLKDFFVGPFTRLDLGNVVPQIKHYKLICSKTPVYQFLHYFLQDSCGPFYHTRRGLIFVRDIDECELVKQVLEQLEYSVDSLHSGISTKQRLQSLENFKSETINILVATDLASRGLDIPQVDWVINLNVPKEFVLYKHRVGRCGRGGREGFALTFVIQVLHHEDINIDVNTKRIGNIEQHLTEKMTIYPLNEELALKNSRIVIKAIAKGKGLVARRKRHRVQ